MWTSATNICQKNDTLLVSESFLCSTTLMQLCQKNALLLNPYSQFLVSINNFCINNWTKQWCLNLEQKMPGAGCQPVCTSWAPKALPTQQIISPRHSWNIQCLLTTPTSHTHLSNYSWLHHSFSPRLADSSISCFLTDITRPLMFSSLLFNFHYSQHFHWDWN